MSFEWGRNICHNLYCPNDLEFQVCYYSTQVISMRIQNVLAEMLGRANIIVRRKFFCRKIVWRQIVRRKIVRKKGLKKNCSKKNFRTQIVLRIFFVAANVIKDVVKSSTFPFARVTASKRLKWKWSQKRQKNWSHVKQLLLNCRPEIYYLALEEKSCCRRNKISLVLTAWPTWTRLDLQLVRSKRYSIR
jgi:hypothetical protein